MALIVAILLAYLRKIDRLDQARSVWIGVGVAVAACVTSAVIFSRFIDNFSTSSAEPWIEGILSLVAGVVLTWMIFWMRGHARGMSTALHSKLDAAIDKGGKAVAVIAFASVAREGFETVLFLLGAQESTTRSGADTVIGGLIGLAIAIGICVLMYGYGRRIDLRKFFAVTGGLLIVFAAGMLAKAAFELIEAMHIEAFEGDSLWTIKSGIFANGWFYDLLKGMFGFSADEATVARVVVYFAYLVPVSWLFYFRGPSKPPTGRVATGGMATNPRADVPASTQANALAT